VTVASIESIRELAKPVLASAGLELWDVEVARDVVRIMVDCPGGVDLDALSRASTVISPLLDDHPEVTPEGRYQLEVSSPGVERTLRTPDQYRRYVGAEVQVKTRVPVEGGRRHHGRLLSAGEDAIEVELRDTAGRRVGFRYDEIERARTVLIWGPTAAKSPAPGRKAPSGRVTAEIETKDAGS
jgi:ribosome maturation factor RimP